jgi:hypothetical protein
MIVLYFVCFNESPSVQTMSMHTYCNDNWHRKLITALPAPTRRDPSSPINPYCSAQEYIKRAPDPMNIGVFLEDAAALTGIGLAALGMGLASYTHSPVFDAAGMALAGHHGHHGHAHRAPTATSAGGSDRKLLACMAAVNRMLSPLFRMRVI